MSERAHPIERLWRECGLPEYFLGNGGTNAKLYELYGKILQAPMDQISRELKGRGLDLMIDTDGNFSISDRPSATTAVLAKDAT